MAHLAKQAKSDLWPSDERQVDVMRWLSWNSQHFTRHAGSLYFQHIIKANFGLGAPDAKAVEEATGFFKQFAGVLNEHLKGRKYAAWRHADDCGFLRRRNVALCGQGEDPRRRLPRDRALARPAQRAAGLAATVPGSKVRSCVNASADTSASAIVDRFSARAGWACSNGECHATSKNSVTREWLQARKAHLAEEKAFTKMRDKLSAARRELPWVRVEEPYVFSGLMAQRRWPTCSAARAS